MAIKKILSIAIAALMLIAISACNNAPDQNKEEKRTMTKGPIYDGVELSETLWETPEYFFESELDREEADIKALYYKTYYRGEETYAFAYLGIPENPEGKKLPAVLLVHGGAGTAYWEWVNLWMKKGFVALAMDLEGHVPTKEGRMTSPYNELYTKSEYAAPSNHNYNDSNLPLDQSWMYYAVQTAIIGNSLLHSLDCVDVYNIGVCGISWGGVITSIITGYDDRFAFSIPIYCTLNMEGTEGNLPGYYERNPAALIWDDAKGLSKVNTPILFIASNNDVSASVEHVNTTYTQVKNGRMVIIDNLLHSQYHAANLLEPYAFAESIVKGKKPLKITEELSQGRNYIKLELPEGVVIDTAKLYYTTEEKITVANNWGKKNCQIAGNIITFSASSDMTAYYITMEDNAGLKLSTRMIIKTESQS